MGRHVTGDIAQKQPDAGTSAGTVTEPLVMDARKRVSSPAARSLCSYTSQFRGVICEDGSLT